MRIYFFIPESETQALADLGLYCGVDCGGYLTPQYQIGQGQAGQTPVVFTDQNGVAMQFPYSTTFEGIEYQLLGYNVELTTEIIPAQKVGNIRALSSFEGDAQGLLNYLQTTKL